jgi:uncharacterized protein YecT (DUF1311 family)
MRFLLAFVIFTASLPNWAQSSDPCLTQRNTLEIDQCGQLTLKAKDKELNEAYQKLVRSLAPADKADNTDYQAVKKQLLDAQRAWIAYRDNDCKAKLKLNESGTIRGAVYLGCLTERTEQRTKELRSWSAE